LTLIVAGTYASRVVRIADAGGLRGHRDVATARMRILPFLMKGLSESVGTALAPDVPSIGEFLPGYSIDGWFGILAPANTPLATREVLSAAIKHALDDSMIRERFAALFMEVVHRGLKEFAVIFGESVGYFRKIVDDLQLVAQ
jgi:tripartite-type tricarboxylate transporter receptor subunit TctC